MFIEHILTELIRFKAQKRYIPTPRSIFAGVFSDTSRCILSPWSAENRPRKHDEGGTAFMFRITYLVFIWKRSIFGFWYRAPKFRTAHVDRVAANRLGRLFTFEDMMGVSRAAQ